MCVLQQAIVDAALSSNDERSSVVQTLMELVCKLLMYLLFKNPHSLCLQQQQVENDSDGLLPENVKSDIHI